jgi:hypothetical protein
MGLRDLAAPSPARLLPSVDAFRLESVLQERLQSGTSYWTTCELFLSSTPRLWSASLFGLGVENDLRTLSPS